MYFCRPHSCSPFFDFISPPYHLKKKNHLAVGSSVDRACKLEAMLLALSNRRKELRTEQSKVDNGSNLINE
jgi:hypothetical protein